MRIPLVLIQGSIAVTTLQKTLATCATVQLIDVMVKDLERITSLAVVQHFFVVVDIDTLEKSEAIELGLSLRNMGYQSFLTCSDDYEDLIELMADIHTAIKSSDRPYKSETFCTRWAMHRLGVTTSSFGDFKGSMN